MRNFTKILIGLLFLTTIGFGQTVAGTKHDLSSAGGGTKGTITNVCVFCHTPHSDQTLDLLWNKGEGTVSTFNTNGPLTTDPTAAGQGTKICMSCHDGTVSVGYMVNEKGSGATGATETMTAVGGVTAAGIIDLEITDLGTDLSHDHPVSILYSEAEGDADFKAQSAVITTLILPDGKIECTTCHDPHDDQFGTFLRVDNDVSALCYTCHTK